MNALTRRMAGALVAMAGGVAAAAGGEASPPRSIAAGGPGQSLADLEKQFRTLPMEARRLTGPLFWLHGDANESKERLDMYLEKVAEGGNGCFTAESRPHSDWLGPRWYRDLGICLAKAKQLDLKMYIFDEKWWPSQMVGGKVPPRYASKVLRAVALMASGPQHVQEQGFGGADFVAAIAGRQAADGIDGASLVDLAGFIKDGTLTWDAPAGNWRIMKFSWQGNTRGRVLVDGASQDCVDWFIKTVYQPHYDHFKDDFGKTIVGYFYDEPETHGDWGTEVMKVLAERKTDWKKALVAWKFRLGGEEQAAARYAYHEAFAEAWGRTMYGGMARWCREHHVVSMGHFLEHGFLYLDMGVCAGNMFQLLKYSDMGGIDLVCRQMYPGQRPRDVYQTPKLGSSITHVYNKADDITMCEMFGAYGQDITYPQMKWLTDQMQVRGVNFMIPHSFNPKSPRDGDCPPYFYNGGFEPRWPLYRVYADYTSRLSLMLSGGHHVCPVAFLFLGNSKHVGKAVLPEDMTTALQDALFDCDWMPYDVFEDTAALDGKEITLHKERYKLLVVPPVEVIPHATLAKAKAFLDAGGVVVGYGFLPSKSATLGKTSADVAALVEAIWGAKPTPGTKACKTSPAGGRSYLLAEKPTPEELQKALAADAGVHPTLEVLKGQTDHWLHVLHRVKAGRDVFLVCNQDHKGQAKDFRFRVTAEGEPECWDPVRNEITAVAYERNGPSVDIDLTLEPLECVLLVFQAQKRTLPKRLTPADKPVGDSVALVRQPVPPAPEPPKDEEQPKPADNSALDGCTWIWFPEGNPAASAPPGARFFRRAFLLPGDAKVKRATLHGTADNDFALFINGTKAGGSDDSDENWRQLKTIDVTKLLRPGDNQLAVRAVNATEEASPAGLIARLTVEFDKGKPLEVRTDKAWKAADREQPGWEKPDFDDKAWAAAKELVGFGGAPWGRLGGRGGGMTRSPVTGDTFLGHCQVPPGLDLAKVRVCLEMDELAPEAAARVTVNGTYAGGVIGKPFRLDVTRLVKPGANTIEIAPFAPKSARLVTYPREAGQR